MVPHYYNCLLRTHCIRNKMLPCAECGQRVSSEHIQTGFLIEQKGWLYKDYQLSSDKESIVFALCRKCYFRFTLNWLWNLLAVLNWKWNKFKWAVKQLTFGNKKG